MKFRKLIATAAVFALLVGSMASFAGCSRRGSTLVIAYDNFSSKFSPFFASTAYDMDVASMTQASMLSLDRVGTVIKNGIDGETIKYNGTDYTYNGIGKIGYEIGATTTYTIEMKQGVKFSDGKPMTIDDYIFSMYVCLDPTFEGGITLNGLPIVGYLSYKLNIANEYIGVCESIVDDEGVYDADNPGYTRTQYERFFDEGAVAEAYELLAQQIYDYVMEEYLDWAIEENQTDYLPADPNLLKDPAYKIAFSMVLWNFGHFDGNAFVSGVTETEFTMQGSNVPTIAFYAEEIAAAYDDPDDPDYCGLLTAAGVESAGANIVNDYLIVAYTKASGGDASGAVPIIKIDGIERLSDYKAKVTLRGFDVTAINQLGIQVAPLHYYGDAAKYNYAQNKFGFDKGNLDIVRSKTTVPMGAGPYVFKSFKKGVVSFEANQNYWDGAPAIKFVNFRETAEGNKLTGTIKGTFDVSTPSFNKDVANEIKKQNSNGALSGDKLQTELVDFLGYGYIGMSAVNVRVAGVGAESSKNLRKALATVFAFNRDVAVDSYYGEQASVIQYPISNTSWAAPKPNDTGYAVAFSKDVNGAAIFAANDTQEQRETKVKAAALGYLQAAGYPVANGKVTGPSTLGVNSKTTYGIYIGGGGKGDHPTFSILTKAKEILNDIGITLNINDPNDNNALWNALDAGTADMWCAAWGATSDPDMYQIYHSKNILKMYGGAPNSTEDNRYAIIDSALDAKIMEARTTDVQAVRAALYKDALDIVMDWACEVPIYQRKEAAVFNMKNVDTTSMPGDITSFFGWYAEPALFKLSSSK